MIFFFFNFIVILFYIITFDLPKGSYLLILLWIILLTSIFSQFSFRLKKFQKKIVNLQFSISIIIFLFLLIEITYLTIPNIFPSDIRSWIDKNKYNYSKVIEELDELPYAKFKPNTLLRTNFYRGTDNQFSYEWTSDQYGFKNTKEISKKKFFDALAIGDSFTEGMGVDIDKTYPSLLTKEGILTYNLGVQGYSLSQSVATLKKFSNNFNYKYILLSYCMGAYPREKIINEYKKKKKLTGGIGQFKNIDNNPDVKFVAYYATSGIWLHTSFIRKRFLNIFKKEMKISNPIFKPYSNSFFEIEEKKISPINLNELALIEKPLLELNEFALENNKKIIVIFHDRKEITYYERATGKKLPSYIFDEFNYLEKFLNKKNITLVNFSKIARDYVNELEENQLKKKLPYLELDGHFNQIGYDILVQKLKNIIN